MYAEWARDLAEQLLAEALPNRWVHSREVGRRAEELRAITGERADLVEAAAYLHDIGYAPAVRDTGFHPLDGARYLRDHTDVPAVVVTAVANHTGAKFEAERRGLLELLTGEFPVSGDDEEDLIALVTHCDLRVGPTGRRTTAKSRLAEILQRYDEGDVVHQAVSRSAPYLLELDAEVRSRLT